MMSIFQGKLGFTLVRNKHQIVHRLIIAYLMNILIVLVKNVYQDIF